MDELRRAGYKAQQEAAEARVRCRQLTSKLAAAMTALSAAHCTIAAADALADAIDAFHTANRALAHDGAQVVSVARALVRIEDALKAYRAARKVGDDG